MSEPGIEPPIIEINGLTKTYQVGDVPVHALRGVDLEIRRQRVCGDYRCFRLRQVDAVPCAGRLDTGYLGNGADQRTGSSGR